MSKIALADWTRCHRNCLRMVCHYRLQFHTFISDSKMTVHDTKIICQLNCLSVHTSLVKSGSSNGMEHLRNIVVLVSRDLLPNNHFWVNVSPPPLVTSRCRRGLRLQSGDERTLSSNLARFNWWKFVCIRTQRQCRLSRRIGNQFITIWYCLIRNILNSMPEF